MKLLASEIQSMFTATALIHSYRRAIEELVYNALDAKATSVAIRINIQAEAMQVIDNGTGVRKTDMSVIGLKHMTSKTIDKNSLQSAPNSYGYRGQALASIIGVTKTVKITSRVEGTSDTFVKVFYRGKEKDFSSAVVRPSKGTTVEIKGFLYNLNIQKANINTLQEIQEIKQFLKRLSLVHQGVSISLRDDTKNEIIFKIHKSRDLYQTIKTLFGVDRKQVQELKVEKKEYKLTAFIGKQIKNDNEVHWTFINGRFIASSKLNEIVDRNMEKALCLKNKDVSKKVGKTTEESHIYKNKIPFYLIFLTCPYNDYDINYSKKRALIEFKNWEQIQGFIEKLVQFYLGDTSLKLSRVDNALNHNNYYNNRKGEVKKIVEKFLASNSKKLGISQTRNGLKGKLIKRNKNKSPTLSKMSSKYKKTSKAEIDKMIKENIIMSPPKTDTHQSVAVNLNKKKVLAQQGITNITTINKPGFEVLATTQKHKNKDPKRMCKLQARRTKGKDFEAQIKSKNEMIIAKHTMKNKRLLKVFDKNNRKVRKRCNFISEKAKSLMKVKPKQLKRYTADKQILFSQAVHYTQANGTHSVSIKKTIQKTYNQKDSKDKKDKRTKCFNKDFTEQIKEKFILKDPVSRSDIFRKPINKVSQPIDKVTNQYNTQFSGLTFQSHNYELGDYVSHEYCQRGNKFTSDPDMANARFITTDSRENFNSENYDDNIFMHKSTFKISRKHCYPKRLGLDKGIFNIQQDTSYTIEFTNTVEDGNNCHVYGKLRDSLLGLNNTFDSTTMPNFTKRVYSIDNNDLSQSQIITQHYTEPNDIDPFINKRNVGQSNSSRNVLNNSDFEDYNCISYKRKRFDINNYNQIDTNIAQKNSCKRRKNVYSFNQTYDVVEAEVHNKTTTETDDMQVISNTKNTLTLEDKNRMNVVFLSNTQVSVNSIELQPINFCETLLGNTQSPKDDNNKAKLTISKEITTPNELLRNSTTDIQLINAIAPEDKKKSMNNLQDEKSHHFQNQSNDDDQTTYPNFDLDEILNNINDNIDQTSLNNESIAKTFLKSGAEYRLHKETGMAVQKEIDVVVAESNFDIKNRPCFLPKGLSPIFANCYSKKQCDSVIEDEYFKNTMYDEFAQNVEMNVEHFKPEVQNVREMTTKIIEKVNARIQKDNASLCFDGSNLRDAKILGQVDNKFIAAKLQTKTSGTIEHLVLFDQHAVHERIRLENNLNEYVTGNQWKSVKLNEIVLKLNQEDILYLHNYRDKFFQLGLNWSNMSDREVCINAIPEAILGKNPRQVDIIIKAVKSLILEEIESIKLQKGSLKLYPKAIMDLVFSEACRYAIKFGDPLSKDDCKKLLKDLCKCKSPFQCAHGRPVMAVVMDIKPLAVNYKVNMTKLNKFKMK